MTSPNVRLWKPRCSGYCSAAVRALGVGLSNRAFLTFPTSATLAPRKPSARAAYLAEMSRRSSLRSLSCYAEYSLRDVALVEKPKGTPHRAQIWAAPPSTNSSEPVTKVLSSEARKTAALAISSGVPKRPIGTLFTILANICWPAGPDCASRS
jgi:hypothetical protein